MLGRTSKLTVFVFLLLLKSTAYDEKARPFAILPKTEARAISHLCSRRAPEVGGGWQPTRADIESLEAHLPDISKLRSSSGVEGARISNPSRYYRQYVGILVGKDKLIYVNAFKHDKPLPSWQEQFANVWCDGGDIAWGAIYDPRNHHFIELATNSGW